MVPANYTHLDGRSVGLWVARGSLLTTVPPNQFLDTVFLDTVFSHRAGQGCSEHPPYPARRPRAMYT
jgi:hypothetical protein